MTDTITITITLTELDAMLSAARAAAMEEAVKVAQDYADHNFARAHKVKNPLKKQACLTKHIAGSHLSTTIRALAPTPTGWVCVSRSVRDVETTMFNLVAVLAVTEPEHWKSKGDIQKLCIELSEKRRALLAAPGAKEAM